MEVLMELWGSDGGSDGALGSDGGSDGALGF